MIFHLIFILSFVLPSLKLVQNAGVLHVLKPVHFNLAYWHTGWNLHLHILSKSKPCCSQWKCSSWLFLKRQFAKDQATYKNLAEVRTVISKYKYFSQHVFFCFVLKNYVVFYWYLISASEGTSFHLGRLSLLDVSFGKISPHISPGFFTTFSIPPI